MKIARSCEYQWGEPPHNCPKNKGKAHRCKKKVKLTKEALEIIEDTHNGDMTWIRSDIMLLCKNHQCRCGARKTQSKAF